MALRDEVALSIERALAQIAKLDKSIARSLRAELKLDTKLALEELKILRKAAETIVSRQLVLRIDTVEAQRKITKVETNVKGVRKLVSSALEFNIATAVATRKLEALHRLARAVRHTVRDATSETGTAGPREVSAQAGQRSLNTATEKYIALAPSMITAVTGVTDVLRNQAIQAGILAGELRAVAASATAFTRAASTPAPILGPGRKELNAVIREEKAALQRAGRSLQGELLGPIDKGRVKAINAETAAVDALSASAGNLNHTLRAAGRTLSVLFTIPTVVAAGFAAFQEFKFQETIQRTKVLTDAFDFFDASGRKVAATSEQVSTRIEGLRQAFNGIATQTGRTPNDIAEAFYFVASAGAAASDRLSILRVSAQGAAIGLGTTAVVADVLTSALNAYGSANLSAAEAGDILVHAVNVAKIEASELAPVLGRLLPLSSELGINFAQTATAAGLLTRSGNSAGIAATQLRGIFQALIRPTSQKAVEILASVGLTIEELKRQIAEPTPTAFIDSLVRLREQSGLSTTELAQLFRRVDGFTGFLSLTNQTNDARKAFTDAADAAKNVSGNLDEFERFARDNQVLKIKQGFSDLLVQLQPLGITVLPFVTKGVGLLVAAFKQLTALLSAIGPAAPVLVFLAAAVGPTVILTAKLRQLVATFLAFRAALNVPGGLKAFARGESLRDIAAGAESATTNTTKLAKVFGALPGLFGVGAAAAIAFFSGAALGSDKLTTQLLGLAGTAIAAGLAFASARSIAQSFGVTSSAALLGIGAGAAVLVAGIAIWRGYSESVNRSNKALKEFQESLKGLTATEAVKKFGATFEAALKKITDGDHTTQIESKELKAALDAAGLSYEQFGLKLQNIVLANPNDINAQRVAIAALGKEVGKSVADGRFGKIADAITGINKSLDEGAVQVDLSQTLADVADITDETTDSFIKLYDKGFIQLIDGAYVFTGSVDDMKAALGTDFTGDATKLLDGFTQGLRDSRQAALDAVGAYDLGSDASGSFTETLDANGESVIGFTSNTDALVSSLSALEKKLTDIVDGIFGQFDKTTSAEFLRTAREFKAELDKAVTDTKPTDKNGNKNENAINFKVDLLSPEGDPAVDFIQSKIDDINANVAKFLSGPDANPELAFVVRELEIGQLAESIGVSVTDLNALLESQGQSTIQLRTQFGDAKFGDVLTQKEQLQTLLSAAPLTLEMIAQIKKDETGLLFGNFLLEEGQKDSKKVIEFIINAENSGFPLATLQTLFGTPDVAVVRNFVIDAINNGVPLVDIAKTLAALDPNVVHQLNIEVATTDVSTGQSSTNAAEHRFELFQNGDIKRQLTINTLVEGADKFNKIANRVGVDQVTPDQFKIATDVDTAEVDTVTKTLAAGTVWKITTEVDDASFAAAFADMRRKVHAALNPLEPGRASGQTSGTERGSIWSGSGFQRFAHGGAINGYGFPRVPMIAQAPRGRSGILWGEPQTHGEAYIPYAPQNRRRAEMLVRQVARDFGMVAHGQPMTMAHGGVVTVRDVGGRGAGGDVGALAAQVATLAQVVASREQQPMIGSATFQSATTDPRATARYLAEDVAAAAARATT